MSNLYIGCAGDLSYGYTGFIDDFKIWNRALPPADISAVYWTPDFSALVPSSFYYTDFSTTPSGFSALPDGVQANGSSFYGWTVNQVGSDSAIVSRTAGYGSGFQDPTPNANASGRSIRFVIGKSGGGTSTSNTNSIYRNVTLYRGYTYTLSFYYGTRYSINQYYYSAHYLRVSIATASGTTLSNPNPICTVSGLTTTETYKSFTFTVPSNGTYILTFLNGITSSSLDDSSIIVRNIRIS